MGERIQGLVDELLAESMRAATIVGLASVPAGFCWIVLVESQDWLVIFLPGVLVGVLYSERTTPPYRAGARTGIFAPIPLLLVQPYEGIPVLWSGSASFPVKVAFTALILLAVLAAWTIFVFVVMGVATLSAVIVEEAPL